MKLMRWTVLAAGLSVAALAGSSVWAAPTPGQTTPPATTAAADPEPAAILRATSPANADPGRTYDDPEAALLEADLDYLVREARRATARGDDNALWPVLVFSDEFAAGRFPAARRVLERSEGGLQGGLADLLEPFLLVAENRVPFAVERVAHNADDLPAPLPDVQRGLVFEAAGRLEDAATVYRQMEGRLDLRPPPDEPASLEDFQRSLQAPRITHAMYRAALVQHRLNHKDEARRLYNIVLQFAPRSADVERNLARLERNEGPVEPALNPQRAAGRWLLFLSEYLTQNESLVALLSQQTPEPGLSSTSGAMFMQIGIALAPDAQDWRLFAAEQLISADGLDGAQRIINLMPADSVFAPDAEIVKANISLQRKQDDQAVAAAERAVQLGGERWSVIASAGDVYRTAGRAQQATAAFDRALSMVREPKDRADILGWRAFAHRFAGNFSAATADMRSAYQIDQSANTRMLFVSILMDDPQNWREGITMARGLFAEDPNNVSRLNALGYALIQHEEGLEEGYRLLWRGFNFGQTDYAVVDSLGWAYYLYGSFDEARALIERARDLSVADPNSEILDHLGDVYWRLNRRDDARAQWRLALEARPDLPRRQSLESKIARGLTAPAPRRRTLPAVSVPQNPGERNET